MLLLAEPDLGTAIALLMMLAVDAARRGDTGARARLALAASRSGPASCIWVEPYQPRPPLPFLHPWHDAQGSGFQIVQAMISMGSGGIFGVGIGNGIGKIFYLPEAQTDMMFANIGEELGLIGIDARDVARTRSSGYAGLKIALGCRDAFGKRLAVGLDHARLRAGGREHRGRDGSRSAHRNPAAVPLLRRLEPRGTARRGGILLNIAHVGTQRQLRCVIAAGGTAGHVLPRSQSRKR